MKSSFKYSVLGVAFIGQLSMIANSAFADEAANSSDAKQQKFVQEAISTAYGILNVVQAFATWFSNRPTSSFIASNIGQSTPVGINPPQQSLNVGTTISPTFAATPIITGQPDIPLNTGGTGFNPTQNWNSNSNYQGVQVSIILLNNQNQPVETRSLNSQFISGERFKLQLVSTYEAIASVDAYRTTPGSNTQNWAGQLYPNKPEQVVKIRSGELVQLPLGPNEYFVFDQQAGLDNLMLNIRHPLAKGAQDNSQPVYRQDNGQYSTFMQLTPQGSFPAVSQLLAFQHNP